jgi:hypothetical protein
MGHRRRVCLEFGRAEVTGLTIFLTRLAISNGRNASDQAIHPTGKRGWPSPGRSPGRRRTMTRAHLMVVLNFFDFFDAVASVR